MGLSMFNLARISCFRLDWPAKCCYPALGIPLLSTGPVGRSRSLHKAESLEKCAFSGYSARNQLKAGNDEKIFSSCFIFDWPVIIISAVSAYWYHYVILLWIIIMLLQLLKIRLNNQTALPRDSSATSFISKEPV